MYKILIDRAFTEHEYSGAQYISRIYERRDI